MPVSTRSQIARARSAAAERLVAPQKQSLRRSTRIAKLNWLKRLRPRGSAQQQQQQQQQQQKQQKQRKLKEVFVMTVNPMFIAPAAPRACTGWSCCCAAPNGFGPGRKNFCQFYSLDPVWTNSDPFVFPASSAQTPPLAELVALPPLPVSPPLSPRLPLAQSPTPALSERTMNMVLATVGVPVKPQSPATDCLTQ